MKKLDRREPARALTSSTVVVSIYLLFFFILLTCVNQVGLWNSDLKQRQLFLRKFPSWNTIKLRASISDTSPQVDPRCLKNC